MIAIGSLKDRVVVENFTTAKNSFGEEQRTWSEFGEFWCKIDYSETGSNEDYTKVKVQSNTTIEFIVRHGPAITTKMRLLYKGDYLNIVSVLEIEYNKYLKIKAIVSDGNEWNQN